MGLKKLDLPAPPFRVREDAAASGEFLPEKAFAQPLRGRADMEQVGILNDPFAEVARDMSGTGRKNQTADAFRAAFRNPETATDVLCGPRGGLLVRLRIFRPSEIMQKRGEKQVAALGDGKGRMMWKDAENGVRNGSGMLRVVIPECGRDGATESAQKFGADLRI